MRRGSAGGGGGRRLVRSRSCFGGKSCRCDRNFVIGGDGVGGSAGSAQSSLSGLVSGVGVVVKVVGDGVGGIAGSAHSSLGRPSVVGVGVVVVAGGDGVRVSPGSAQSSLSGFGAGVSVAVKVVGDGVGGIAGSAQSSPVCFLSCLRLCRRNCLSCCVRRQQDVVVGGVGVCSPSAVVASGGEREGGVVSSACRGDVNGCCAGVAGCWGRSASAFASATMSSQLTSTLA